MGRYGAPRPVRYIFGAVLGASVFVASSVAMFSLAASAGSPSLLGAVGNTVNGVTNTVGSTVSGLAGPSGVLCNLLCSVSNPLPQASGSQPANPLSSGLPCLNTTLCAATKQLTGPNPLSGTASTGTTNSHPASAQAPAAAAGNGALGGASGGEAPAVPRLPAGVAGASPSLVQPAPGTITLPSATSGINFGKAPFLWPLFLGLDVLGAAAVVLALRKTWSRSTAD
ncbi:MAG TPA: hypothetical protein VF155_04895 [Candidatus Dormibacteraeota bacterium]